MAMAAMNMVSAGVFLGVSFHLKRFPQGVAYVHCKKTPIFGSRRSKLHHLTVFNKIECVQINDFDEISKVSLAL
jgi:hypothetical protein